MKFFSFTLIAVAAVNVAAFTPTPRSGLRQGSSSLYMSSALIVQNKGGGHGELGYQLAKTLSDNPKITSVTILQDDSCDDASEPFKSYPFDLPDVEVIRAPLGDDSLDANLMRAILDRETYDYVWDNASKKPEGAAKAICDLAKGWDVKLYTYVSSAGIYITDEKTPFPMAETTPAKESAGQVLFEQYVVESGLPLVSFRPQYIYGPKSNKHDYIDWYFDRIVRDLPLPIPDDGSQKVSLTNSEDVASLLTSVLNDEEAAKEQRFFNCGTDDLPTYDEVAFMCAEAAGVAKDAVKIEHYDGDKFGKAKFPFRLTDFYVAPDMAKSKLGWTGPKHSLKGDLPSYFESYKARGAAEKKMSLEKDWEIVSGCGSKFAEKSLYDAVET